MKVSDSLDNVPNENVVTQQVTDQPTDRVSDQLHELLEWLFATKKDIFLLPHHPCTRVSLSCRNLAAGLPGSELYSKIINLKIFQNHRND